MTAIPRISPAVLDWYDQHGRKDLPWQDGCDAYAIWISEIMLQQTQVTTVIPYFNRFMRRFPGVNDLAAGSIDEVLALWSGLGYYARARNLHAAAQQIMDVHDGEFPLEFDQVLALPGIGRSTAGAILAFSTGQRWPILDGNVRRVLCRYYGVEGYPGRHGVEKGLWQLAEQNTPEQNVAEYTQAIMDLGATVCTRSAPACETCPLSATCLAYACGRQQQLPTPRPKKTLPTRQTVMLMVLNDDDEVLLQRRPPAGIWGGLWSLPECPASTDIPAWCEQNLGLIGEPVYELAPLKHSFSHYHLDIRPQILKAASPVALKEDNLGWFDDRQFNQLGLPKPVKLLLNQLDQINEQNRLLHQT